MVSDQMYETFGRSQEVLNGFVRCVRNVLITYETNYGFVSDSPNLETFYETLSSSVIYILNLGITDETLNGFV